MPEVRFNVPSYPAAQAKRTDGGGAIEAKVFREKDAASKCGTACDDRKDRRDK